MTKDIKLSEEQYKEMIGCMLMVLEDWWPLVHDRTSRVCVRSQGKRIRDFLDSLNSVSKE